MRRAVSATPGKESSGDVGGWLHGPDPCARDGKASHPLSTGTRAPPLAQPGSVGRGEGGLPSPAAASEHSFGARWSYAGLPGRAAGGRLNAVLIELPSLSDSNLEAEQACQ